MFNSRILRNAVLVATVAVLATGGAWAKEAAKPKRGATAGMMWAIPAESLVCVRINKFDATLDSVNAFLKDVAPGDTKAALLSKLTGVLGGDQLAGVNKKGNIAIFVLNVPGESPTPGPMGNMFIGALLPVAKYENFVSRNPNVGEPDEQGISAIAANGKPMALATNFRSFALLCPPNARDQLVKVKKMLNQRKNSLGAGLDADMVKQAASSPVWVYVNVKQASPMIQPMVLGGLQQMKAQIEKAKESGEELPMDPAAIAGIFDFYGGILKAALEGTDNVTLGLTPSAESCKLTVGLKPIPDTIMAAAVGEPLEGDLSSMLGHLEDGAMFNLAAKVDRKSLKATYGGLFKLLGKMIPGGLSDADLEELQQLMTKGFDAMGDSLALTMSVNSEVSPPFGGKYVIGVKDRAAFEEVLKEELKLMEEGGVLSDLYKGFGMQMDVKIDEDAGNYRGTKIGAAKVVFKAGGGDAMQAKMFEKMFGDGLDYKWAFEKGTCVYTFGGDTDGTIRETLDQVRAGGPGQIGSEMKAALQAIGDTDRADVIGTLNYARAISMAFGFMPFQEGLDLAELKVESKSNIAFAGRTTDAGNLALQIVMPKEHLLEIKSIFENIIPKIEEQQRKERQKRKETAQANNM